MADSAPFSQACKKGNRVLAQGANPAPAFSSAWTAGNLWRRILLTRRMRSMGFTLFYRPAGFITRIWAYCFLMFSSSNGMGR